MDGLTKRLSTLESRATGLEEVEQRIDTLQGAAEPAESDSQSA